MTGVKSTGSGLDTVWTHNPENDIREVDGATFHITEIKNSYNRTTYRVELLAGNMPPDKVVLAAFGADDLFGGSVQHNGENLFTINVRGSD